MHAAALRAGCAARALASPRGLGRVVVAAVRRARLGSAAGGGGQQAAPPIKIGVPTATPTAAALTEARFHDVADHTLEAIMTLLAPLESELDDVDVSYSQGVLNINLGPKGFWVINKQTPNRQLWWSSPLSGPRRYEYRGHGQAEDDGGGVGAASWTATADGNDLLWQLRKEMRQVSGIDI